MDYVTILPTLIIIKKMMYIYFVFKLFNYVYFRPHEEEGQRILSRRMIS